MFYRGSFFFRLLAALLVAGFLFLGAVLVFQAGRSVGFTLGAESAGGELPPSAAQYPFMHYYAPFPFFPFWGLLCFAGLGFFLIFGLTGAFRRKYWHPHPEGGYPRGWHEGYDSPWGPPPWWREKKPEEPPQGGSGQEQGAADKPGQ